MSVFAPMKSTKPLKVRHLERLRADNETEEPTTPPAPSEPTRPETE